jgi:hypothetical protein
MDRQTDRQQTDRQADSRQTDSRQTDSRQTDRQTDRQAERVYLLYNPTARGEDVAYIGMQDQVEVPLTVSVFVYVFVCTVYVCVYIWMHTQIEVPVTVSVFVYVCVYVRMNSQVSAYPMQDVCMYAYMHACMYHDQVSLLVSVYAHMY